MADLAEVKSLFEQGNKTLHDLRTEFEALKGKAADFVDADRVKRIEEAFAEQLKAEREAKAALEERLAKAETRLNRPGAIGANPGDEEAKSFCLWARGKPSDFEQKAMAENSNPDGGFLVPPTMRDGIAQRLRRSSPVRSVASVVQITGNAYQALVERGDAGFEWVGETQARVETATPTIDRIEIAVHELSAMPKVSQRMLDDASFDVAGWLTGYVSDRFARAEATGFVSGDGVNKPRGFLAYPTAAQNDAARAAATLEHVPTGTSGAFDATNPADKIIDLIHALHPAYRQGAVFMVKSEVAATMAKFKGQDDQYLFHRTQDGDGGYVTRMFGYQVVEAEDMPALAASSLSLAFGNFGVGYQIVDNGGVRILRDPYSAKPNVMFYTTKRTGGGVLNFDAIKLLRFATT